MEYGSSNNTMTDNLEEINLDEHYIFFPAGGAFNKIRANSPNSQYLDKLLDDCQPGYVATIAKRAYVQEHILNRIPGGLKMWKGRSPTNGCLVALDDHDAYEKIAQVLRDRKKARRRHQTPPPPPCPTTPSPSRRAKLGLRPMRSSDRKPGAVRQPGKNVVWYHGKRS